jgi:hypothetical protein
MKNNCQRYRRPFELCVDALEWAAKTINPFWPGGMDYIKINVLIFCVVGPLIFAASVALNILLLARWIFGGG